MLENTELFLERASSSDQIKSSMFFSLQFYIHVVEVLHCVSQKSNSFPFFIISLKSWKYLRFISHFVDFPQKCIS